MQYLLRCEKGLPSNNLNRTLTPSLEYLAVGVLNDQRRVETGPTGAINA